MDRKNEDSDNLGEIQKKTFTRWINEQFQKASLPISIRDLYKDFRDGKLLLSLLQIVTGQPLIASQGQDSTGVDLISQLLGVLDKFNVKSDEISAGNVHSGDRKTIHSLIWAIILRWHIEAILKSIQEPDAKSNDWEAQLLAWCQRSTQGYRNVEIHDFTTCWRDGLAFNAIIHKHCPDLFSYDLLLSMDNVSRLNHVFTFANTKLLLPPLLDADDVDINCPEKRSIMIYLVSIYDALSKDKLDAMNDAEISDTHFRYSMPVFPASSETSLYRGVSLDFGGFMGAVNETLVWLLDACKVLSSQPPIAQDTDELKEQFHHHEKFMMQLTQRQNSIGNVLQEGNHLLVEGHLTPEEESQVEHQMALLNNRWEELRLQAMDRQTRLQQSLMGKQQQQLDSLSDWLTSVEDRISACKANSSSSSNSERNVHQQIKEQKTLQAEIGQQQLRVSNLQSMVVVVDETNSESAYAALEQQLEVLGSRWASVCRWVEEYGLMLQEALARWHGFNDRLKEFTDWLTETESTLAGMRTINVSDINQVVEHVQCLKSIENDMDEMMKCFDELNDFGLELVQYIGNDEAGIQSINAKLQECQERWDSLVQLMEQNGKEIVHSGIELTISKSHSGSQMITVSRKGEKPVTVSLTSSLASSRSSSAKKPRLESGRKKEFDRQVAALSQWLDQTEVTQELITTEPENIQDRLTIEEQLVLIEDAEKDVKAHEKDMEQMRIHGKALWDELRTSKDSTDAVDEVMQRLESRWKRLNELLLDNMSKVNLSSKSKQVYSELSSLQEVVVIYEKWVLSEGPVADEFMELSRQMEHCRVKLKAFLSHESQMQRINACAKELVLSSELSAKILEKDLKELNSRWLDTHKKLSERQILLTKALQKTPPKSFMDSFLSLVRWLDGIEKRLDLADCDVNVTEVMERHITTCRDIQLEMRDRLASLEYINHTGQDLMAKAPTGEKSLKLRNDLQRLNSKWSQVQSTGSAKIATLESRLEQLKLYKSQTSEVMNWVEEMELFLTSEEAAIGDITALQAQLLESDGALEDMKTMKSILDTINCTAEKLRPESNETFILQFDSDLELLNERWKNLVRLSQKHDVKLRENLDVTQKLLDDIELQEKWIDKIIKDHLAREYTVHSELELAELNKKFQDLDEEMKSSRQFAMKQLEQRVANILASRGSAQELSENFTKVKAKWTDMCRDVEKNRQKFVSAEEDVATFGALISEETIWVNELEEKLSKASKLSGDAEELSEELEDMESFLATRKEENVGRINEVAQVLLNNHIMVAMITTDRDGYMERQKRIMDEAKQRAVCLTEAVLTAQNRESQIVEVSQWMTDVTTLLQARLDADILAGDTPKEFESLKAEFEQHETILADFDKEVTVFREESKMEEAERLEQQLLILKKHYAEVSAKFCKFQRPVDFDPKLAHIKHVLEELEEQIHILDISSLEPEHLQTQLDHCMKFYKTMSEIKPEVEYVIKTGRQVVEKKQVDSPEKLNAGLDNTKQLYNELGAQVTQSKSILDQTLKLMRKLTTESTALSDFIGSTNEKLREKGSNKYAKDIEDELIWIKTAQLEVSKMQPHLTTLTEVIGQLHKIVDESILTKLDDRVKELTSQMNDLTSRISQRKKTLQELSEELEKAYVDFETTQRELMIWMDNTEDFLNELDTASSMDESMVEQMQQIVLEHSQLISQLDQVRDSAVDIISRSNRYSKTVEPLLTLLNQRWQEITDRLKDKQTLKVEVAVKQKRIHNDSAVPTIVLSTDEEPDFGSALSQLLHELEEYHTNLVEDKGSIQNLSGPQANDKLMELRENEEMLRTRIDDVLNDECFLAPSSAASDSEADDTIQREDLQVTWKKVLNESERQCLSIILNMADFTEFRLAAEEMDHWLNGVEQRLVEAAGDEDQIKTLDEELMKKKSTFDSLTKKMNQLHSSYARMKAFELLNLLNCHFSCLLRQVNLYLKTANFSSHVSLRRLSVRKIVFVSETSQYIRDLQSLTGMLSDLELELKTPIIPDCQPDLTNPQEDEFKTIEDALDAIQCSMESAENSKEEALSMASEKERSRVDETLRDLRARLFALQKETADRKRSEEDLLLSVDRFTSQLDDITSWLNETENILNNRISAADRDQMCQLLDIVKERERHLHGKQMLLRSLSQNGRPIFYHPDIVPLAKERIMRDLSSAIERWNKVVFMLPKKRHTLEERLHSLDLFYDELEKLSLLIPAAKIQLDTLQHMLSTSRRTSDKDVKVIRDVLEVGQCDVDRLKQLYSKLQANVKESEAGVPDLVKQRMDDILADWTILHGQAVILQNTVVKQEPDKSEVPVEENIRQFESSVMQSENMSFPSPSEVLSGSSELDEKVSSLDRAIQGAVQDVLLYKVEIGNIRDIETTVRNGKVKIAELELYRQELEEFCELLLKTEMKCDEDRLLMEQTVERLRKRSEETKANLTERNAKLEDMLLECRQFEQMNIEFERWIISLEEECMAQHATVGHTITAFEELIEANKRLQLEASPWQSRVDSLHSMADKLVEEYKSDDGTNLKALLDRTDERWNSLLTRLTNQAKLLQNSLNSIYRFDADLKDFFLWLTKVEIVLKHHDELMSNDNTMSDEVQRLQVHQAFKDLQCEINEHQDTLESLNSTGKQIILGLQTGKVESLQNQLDDMNQRWNRLKLKSGELRNRLDVQVNGNSDGQELQQILELTNWLTQLDNDLGALNSLGGKTSALQHQRDRTKEIRSQLDTKRTQVEQLLKQKRQTDTSDEKRTTAEEMKQNLNSEESKLSAKNALTDPIDLLNQKWTEVNLKSVECGVQINQASEKMEVFETSVNDATQFLMLKELVISRWPPVAEVAVDSLPGELSQIKSFHVDLIANQSKIEACKLSASELLKDKNCVLSATNKSRLENVHDRWQTLETTIEERLQQVITAMKECGSGTQYHLSMAVFPPWERSVAEAKVPYYINHSMETTQWDHPEMTRILSSLAEFNTVKFSAYRTSMKLRLLQKRLSFDRVSMEQVLEAFERNSISQSSLTPVTVSEIIQCLTSIYGSLPPPTTHGTSTDINVSLCIDLVLNWLLNMYDSSRTGQVQSLSFRVAILVMCSANLDDKYKALFKTVANADGSVTQQELGLLLHSCIQIPKQLGEIAAFGGSNIEPSVRSCFEKFGNPSELKASHFLSWMKLEPQSMVWLPVLHRLAAAESAKHQAKCNVCKDCPILGLRYRCLKCFSFDMCQNCFFSGRKAKSHKLTHPMQEYCSTTTSSEDMRDFTKMFKNKFRSKQYFKKHPRLGYLPVQSLGETDTLERNPVTIVEFMSTPNASSPSKAVVTNSRSSTPSTGSLNSQNQDHHSAKKQAALCSSPAQSSSQNNSISTLEMHSRLEIYASRLAEVEQRRRETTPDWDDEHNLISQYCQSLHGNSATHTLQSPMQIMMAMDAEQRAELEAMIRDLEEENKLLQAEYDQLKEAHREESVKSPYDNVANMKANSEMDGHDAEMIAEARLLRQHKGRLEARMQILEDHNRQLDSQLRRLRQLLAEQPESDMRIVTYPFSQSPATASGITSTQSSLPQRGPPSFASSMRQNGHNFSDDRGHLRSLNGNTEEGHLETGNDLESLPGKNNIDNLFQVAEEVGRAVETLVNIMTDDERHAEEEKDLVTRQQQQRKS